MNRRINVNAIYLPIIIACFLFFQPIYGQTDIVTLARAKDFINASLTYQIISRDSIQKNITPQNQEQINEAFRNNTLEHPLYYAAMQKLLEGNFDLVTKKFSARVDEIDVGKYAAFEKEKAIQSIYDSAFEVMQQQYPTLLPAASKDSMYLQLLAKANTNDTGAHPGNTDTILKQPIKKSEAPSYVPWYAKFQGFLFWLLVCVLISVALFLYCMDQLRQLKNKLSEVEKNIEQSKDEKEHAGPSQGPVTTVYTEFRNLVTLKIKELYDIVDHLNMRIVELEIDHKPGLIEQARQDNDSVNNEKIFYMAAPVEGYFPFSARCLKKDALYKFTISDENAEAHFEVINDGMPINQALSDMANFFEPACIAENELQGEVRVIITKIPGITFFDGDKWTIQQKATILFI